MLFDLIVIGGGPAGYTACERARQAGFSVCCFEERNLGGVCLNEGCIPTKTLLYSAKILELASQGEKYGVSSQCQSIDHKKVLARKNKVVKTLVTGVKSMLKANQVVTVEAHGEIKGKTEEGYIVEANGETFIGKRLLIATGSSPIIPPIPGLREGMENGFVLTSREVLSMENQPKHLVVIGGGVIGLELASYFNSIGTLVTVIEMLDHIAGDHDPELVKILQKNLESRGVRFLLTSKVTELTSNSVQYEQDGSKSGICCDQVLLSIGRHANTQGFGLENIGVRTERGAIVTDDQMKTSEPDVYAAGDVNGKSMLAHTAYREAEVAVSNMIDNSDTMRYNAIPSVLYTNPELSSVGETEQSAKKCGLDVSVVKLPMRYSGRYLAENEGGIGVMKLVVEKSTRKILGLQALSNYSSEFIVAAGSYIELGLTVEEVKKIIFPHPTVCEIIREAIHQIGE